jgi:hypothetical protein
MKKLLALLPLIGAFALTGCGDNGDDGGDGDANEGEHLPYNKQQVEDNVATLSAEGYEIKYVATDSESEKYEATYGLKDNYFWYESGDNNFFIYANGSKCQQYEFDEVENKWKKDGELFDIGEGVDLSKTYKEAYSAVFYQANYYDSVAGFKKVKELTFAGRSATEYKFHQGVAGIAEVNIDLIIDNTTGMTLYWDGSGRDYTNGESGSASYEVTSFKVGIQVVIPDHEAVSL